MSRALLIVLVCFSFTFRCSAKSIFDFGQDPADKNDHPDDTKPKDAPEEKPNPEVKPNPEIKPPAEPEKKEEPELPAEQPKPQQPQPQPAEKPSGGGLLNPNIGASPDTKEKAELNLLTSKTIAEKNAEEDKDYQIALKNEKDARDLYDKAKRDDDTASLSAAFSNLSRATAERKKLYASLIDSDKNYQEAKKKFAQYPVTPPTVANNDKKDEVSPEIAQAIADRNLIEGMSLRQAKQVARTPITKMSKIGDKTTYRWYFKGRTGTTTVVWHTNAFGQRIKDETADFGVIGYVEASFVNDKLTEFSRWSIFDRQAKDRKLMPDDGNSGGFKTR